MKKDKYKLTQERIGLIATSLARKNSFFNELIPNFTNRDKDLLAEILRDVDKSTVGTSGRSPLLFYYIITRKPFPSGNRRIALAVLFYSLAQEGKWLKAGQDKLYDLTHWVSLSPADAGEEIAGYVERFIKKYAVKMENGKK